MPQLGATDYTPFMQGAIRGSESVARGIEALGAGVAKGIDAYQQNKELNKQAEAVIKSADKQAATLKKILPMLGGELEAQIGPSLDALLTSMSDTNLSVRQRAQIAQQGLKDFGETLNLGISARQMQEKEREKMAERLAERTIMSVAAAGAKDPLASASRMLPSVPRSVVDWYSTQQARDAATAKTRAETVEILAGKPTKPGSFQAQTFDALRAAEEQKLGRALSTSEAANLRMRVLRSGPQSVDPERAATTNLQSKRFEGIISLGESGRRVKPTLRALSQKLEQGLKTGKLEGFKTDAIGFAKSLGVPVDEVALGDSEAARGMFNQLIIEYFQATKGAITERENALFMSMGPEFIKTPKANKMLLDLAADRIDLDERLATIVNDGLAENIGFDEINRSLKKATEDYDKMLAKKYGSIEEAAPSGAPFDFRAAAAREIERRRRLSQNP